MFIKGLDSHMKNKQLWVSTRSQLQISFIRQEIYSIKYFGVKIIRKMYENKGLKIWYTKKIKKT